MPQETDKILPSYLNLDIDYSKLNPDESPFIKGLSVNINANPESGNGTNNPTQEGQNILSLTPTRSNIEIPGIILPGGYNKNCGSFESVTTQELYYFNFNGETEHGIYVLDGNTGQWSKVIEDPKLAFSDNQEAFIAEHRVQLRVIYDEDRKILEKYLIWTDGQVWQGWVNVIAAIKTNGFDTALFPYWSLQPPHFDREELFQYPVRPPMVAPIITKLQNTDADKGKVNNLIDQAFEFCYNGINTDVRETTVSPYSLPSIIKTSEFLFNPDLLPKKLELLLYAGSCMWEKINIYFRKTVSKKNETGNEFLTWSDWFLYDTIYKYSDCGDNSMKIIGTEYWKRKNAWSDFSYDSVQNTIKYIFDNSKVGQIVDQGLFEMVQNDIPQLSIAGSPLGDSVLFANNRYGYDNFSCEVTDNIGIDVVEDNNSACKTILRKIRLYVYAGRDRGNQSGENIPPSIGAWLSQPGYFIGDDKQMRFGGISFKYLPLSLPEFLDIDTGESKSFDLDFADKDSFRVYLKGTPYYADATWHLIKPDFTLSKLNGLLDSTNESDRTFILNSWLALEMFVGVFDLEVPAGKYIATLGRHNVPNNEDYRSKSTYIMGIANSRLAANSLIDNGLRPFTVVKAVKPNALVTASKEMEIDCTSSNIDVWGNGADLFYVFTPFIGSLFGDGHTNNRWAFIEGYLFESKTDLVPIEDFPYIMDRQLEPPNPLFPLAQLVNTGSITDKNGFFWGFIWGTSSFNVHGNILFNVKLNCIYPTQFTVQNNNDGVPGWKPNNIAYLTDYNNGQVGTANRVLYKVKITDLIGLIPYSNIGISIKDGATEFTNSDGEATLIIHNGFNKLRQDNVYVNAGGNFLITIADCGFLPLLYYDESLVPCQTVTERIYPIIQSLKIGVNTGEFQSLKQGASYVEGIVGADLAGRQTFTSKTADKTVPSFLQRNNTASTHFKWFLNGALKLNSDVRTKDIKWIGFYTTLAANYKKYIQWVGDKIEYIDSNGNVTTDTSSAKLVRITIDSLLEANIQSNFTLLSNYQFVRNDRLRVLDDGDGNLFDTATYGSMIDVEIQGSNYNQAAINAGLIIPPTNTVLQNASNPVGTNPTTLFVNYDSRFDKLKDKTGFWIELFTPSENNDKIPFFAIKWYPIINGEIAIYIGGGVSNPQYIYPTSGDLEYWDTYLIKRNINIPNVGNKFIDHPFESPNVSDSWGANLQSGGQVSSINPNAKQTWFLMDTIRSDIFSEGLKNGLGTFRSVNRKGFKRSSLYGGIMCVSVQGSVILFLCGNDYMVCDFNYNFIYANAQGIQVANLDNNIGEPHQKVGSNYGCSYEHTGTVIIYEKIVSWYDAKNEGYIICNYQSAEDISDITDKDGRKYGIKSYLVKKTQFINGWNLTHGRNKCFDVISGIDTVRKNIFLSFRPRRENTNDLNSYVNHRRNIDLKHQETLVYNIDSGRWTKTENFVSEAYGKLRGNSSGAEFISFAAGKPYTHNKNITSFLNFFGQQTEPVVICVLNKGGDFVKILQAISQDIIPNKMFVDMIYENQINSFSYIPANLFIEKEKRLYGAVLRDMSSYLEQNGNVRSTLHEGKRMFGSYFVIRFIGEYESLSKYNEIKGLLFLFTASATTKP